MQTFRTYSDAREADERVVRELANGSNAATFSATQSRDALAGAGAAAKLLPIQRTPCFPAGGQVRVWRRIGQVEGAHFERSRRGLSAHGSQRKAIEEFFQARVPLIRAGEGQRAQLSRKYAYNRELRLRRFAEMFPNTAFAT